MATLPDHKIQKKPAWLKVKLPTHENFFYVSNLVKKKNLNTICQSAKCPNVSECWSHRTATFLILGDTCTRNCAFCAVKNGIPLPPSLPEPVQVAESIAAMNLKYAVITSVTRDDLPDGGASLFVKTIAAVHKESPSTKLEVLIPDLQGNLPALEAIISAGPEVLNHNLEAPEPVYPLINRPRLNYHRSLQILQAAKRLGAVTKSGIMIGLGETDEEILCAFQDLREVGCDLLTIGQYLQATKNNMPVQKYYPPQEFERLRNIALDTGFIEVVSGPLVRSSYMAHNLFAAIQNQNLEL